MKKGSIALMVCVKDTFTLPRLALVVVNPSACSAARGSTCRSCSASRRGARLNPEAQSPTIRRVPTPRCTSVQVTGKGKAFRARLL